MPEPWNKVNTFFLLSHEENTLPCLPNSLTKKTPCHASLTLSRRKRPAMPPYSLTKKTPCHVHTLSRGKHPAMYILSHEENTLPCLPRLSHEENTLPRLPTLSRRKHPAMQISWGTTCSDIDMTPWYNQALFNRLCNVPSHSLVPKC